MGRGPAARGRKPGRSHRLILALDIATTTGWAFSAQGAPVPLFGEHHMGGVASAVVFDRFHSWLDAKLRLLTPQYLFVEDTYPPRSIALARRLYGLRALADMLAHQHSVRIRAVPSQTVHRFFTGLAGQRSGDKKATTIRVCKSYGWNVESDDEADALALWLYAEHQLAPNAAAGRSRGTLFAAAG